MYRGYVVRRSAAAAADADQVPAGLHLPASRAHVTCPLLHARSDHLLGRHVGCQEHQRHQHRLPAHGVYLAPLRLVNLLSSAAYNAEMDIGWVNPWIWSGRIGSRFYQFLMVWLGRGFLFEKLT